jgi:hypothetical protein
MSDPNPPRRRGWTLLAGGRQALNPARPQEVYDLSDCDKSLRDYLSDELDDHNIAHEWDHRLLSVYAADQHRVDDVLDRLAAARDAVGLRLQRSFGAPMADHHADEGDGTLSDRSGCEPLDPNDPVPDQGSEGLIGWDTDRIQVVLKALWRSDIDHTWDVTGDQLLFHAGDRPAVTQVLDRFRDAPNHEIDEALDRLWEDDDGHEEDSWLWDRSILSPTSSPTAWPGGSRRPCGPAPATPPAPRAFSGTSPP